jgi:hypothetical protein
MNQEAQTSCLTYIKLNHVLRRHTFYPLIEDLLEEFLILGGDHFHNGLHRDLEGKEMA